MVSVASTLLIAASVAGAPELSSTLEALGREEARKDALGICRFVERVRVEELDSDGKVKGAVVREFAVERGVGTYRRTLLSEELTGELNGKLAERNDPTPEQVEASRSPFHPEAQRHYRFEGPTAEGEGRVAVSFRPHAKHPQRLVGRAVIDAETERILSISGVPSKRPMFVDEVKVEVDFAPTACGVTMVRSRTRGEAGALFMKVRFRISSELREFRAGG